MKTKQQKKEDLKKLEKAIPESKITIFTSFSKAGEKGLSVAQVSELRRLLRAMHSQFIVTKKTLIDLAMKEAKKEVDIFSMPGSLGLVAGPLRQSSGEAREDDAYAIAKKVYEFSRKNQALRFFGALVDGQFITADQFIEMAKMPSRETLLGRLFGMMKYPISSMAIVMNEIGKKKVVTA